MNCAVFIRGNSAKEFNVHLTRNRVGFFLWVTLVSSALQVKAENPVNQLSEAEKKAGWILLFDGTNKTAEWKVGESGDASSNDWEIDEGAMKSPNKQYSESMLFTKRTFDNFEWKADWKLNKGGNSGLFIRVPVKPGWFCGSYEFAIQDDSSGGDRNDMSSNPGEAGIPIKRTGAVYDIVPTSSEGKPIPAGGKWMENAKPFDQWNSGVIFANGNFVEHWLNGQKLVDFEIGSKDYQERYTRSKFARSCEDSIYAKAKTGFLGVQDHGKGLITWIRNLKIRPFTPGEKLNSPLITPNGGSFSGVTKVVLDAAITGATLHYTKDGSDPDESSPKYSDTLVLNASVTLKTRTFRPKFQPSTISSATFSINGVAMGASGGEAPTHSRLQISQLKNCLRLESQVGTNVAGELVSLAGRTVLSFTIQNQITDIDVSKLESGVYLLRLGPHKSPISKRIFLP